ncbi:MAG TPA: metalloregulator ArsR/SmtB family transcription factor [Polyangiaceae bacterium]|jgi:DNA-binding transcriptional ArsR family regulator|nr:metalloregulator ArsR/SmtB family transcription factor [Polyangiaceae bacterium]
MVQYSPALDTTFSALSDATRRGILEQLGRRDASISELAERFEMTLTGIKKHVQVLEQARLVTSEKAGRVRTCRLGPRRLKDEAAWISKYRSMLEARLDSLESFLERSQGEP